MISTEPISPLEPIEAVRAQGGYFNSKLDLASAKVTARALASESIGVR
jgi:hypothetical protein